MTTVSRLVAVFFLYVLSCTTGDISDPGGGIDIGNPTKICVVDSHDRPVTNASVKIIPSGQWLTSVFGLHDMISDSFITDDNGMVAFDPVIAANCNLQIDHSIGGAFIAGFHPADSATGVNIIALDTYRTLSGTIGSNSGTPVEIRFDGTAYSTPVKNDGSYQLKTVIDGACIPLIMAADSSWSCAKTILFPPGNAIVNIDDVSFTSLMIEDFEDTGNTVKIGRFLKESVLYTTMETSVNATVTQQIVAGRTEGGKVLQATLVRRSAWALLGFHIGVRPDGDSLWNFSSATGLSFYAKGSGRLNVSLESDTIDRMGYYKHYSKDIVLQEQWQYITIPFDSLTFKNDLNATPDIGWEESARSIKRIEFNALEGDTVECWLDDIMVNGIDFSTAY